MDTITADQFRAEPGVEDWLPDASGAVAEFTTGDFATGAKLFDAIAELAEAANHHPDVTVTYPSVRVTLITHSAGGLTAKDVALARRISAAARNSASQPRGADRRPGRPAAYLPADPRQMSAGRKAGSERTR